MRDTNNNPLLTVILVTYNSENVISQTIHSILNQTFTHFKLFIFDNHSSDNTRSILNNFKKRDTRISVFYSKQNLGPYVPLNYMIQKAKTKYIAIQDHDDIWNKNKLKIQVNFLESNPTIMSCGAKGIFFFEKENQFFIPHYTSGFSKTVPHPTLVFKNKGKKYDTSILYKTDEYFMQYILNENKKRSYLIDKYLYIKRIRNHNTNYNLIWLKLPFIMTYFLKTYSVKKLILAYIKKSILTTFGVRFLYTKILYSGTFYKSH